MKQAQTSDLIYSFSPIVDENSRILILGTALKNNPFGKEEYYAHSKNVIWKIIASICHCPNPRTYSDKMHLLKKTQIALWDICYCYDKKKNHLDKTIKNVIPNEIPALLRKYPNIEVIAFNGRASRMMYDKYFKRYENITYTFLYSSNSANTYSSASKLATWLELVKYMNEKIKNPPRPLNYF